MIRYRSSSIDMTTFKGEGICGRTFIVISYLNTLPYKACGFKTEASYQRVDIVNFGAMPECPMCLIDMTQNLKSRKMIWANTKEF